MTATGTRKRRRAGIAWLAVLALLISALVPISLAAAAGQPPEAASGWCVGGHGNQHPGKGHAAPFCDHCAVCTVAAGLEPPVATVILAPIPLRMLAGGGLAPAALPPVSAYRPAQPRGPPVEARI